MLLLCLQVYPTQCQTGGGHSSHPQEKGGASSTRHGTPLNGGGWAAISTAWILEQSESRVPLEALLGQWIHLLTSDMLHARGVHARSIQCCWAFSSTSIMQHTPSIKDSDSASAPARLPLVLRLRGNKCKNRGLQDPMPL